MDDHTQSDEIEALESIYGSDFKKEYCSDTSYSIEVIPNVILFLTLNASYPSESPPIYQLLAPSLSKQQKHMITQAFEDIYLQNIGYPVLFQWIEKLKEIVQAEDDNKLPNAVVNDEKELNFTQDKPIFNVTHGPIIQDRRSTFQGHVCEVNSESDIGNVMNSLLENKKIAQATHNMLAYRIEKEGGILLQDCEDDGECHAGGRLLHLLQILEVKNVVVVVTRWYGGIHLGPDRFRHINNAARATLQLAGYIK